MSAVMKALEERGLPSLLTLPDGRTAGRAEWESILRPYWRELLLREEYGEQPPLVTPTVTAEKNPINWGGKISWEQINFCFTRGDRSHTVKTQLLLPMGRTGVPCFLVLNFRPDIPDRYLPVEEIIDNGFGIFTVCYEDVTADNGDFTSGLAALFSEGEARTPHGTGKIGYWAYMASRMMDYLVTRPEVDPHAVGVAGHSRLGKTALLTAALDERFAFACSNDSGCSGAALARGRCEGGESLRVICSHFPYWFAPQYQSHVDREREMPFDQHCLLSLIAPRGICVGGAIDDVWADNDNQFLSCVAADAVFRLYGVEGLSPVSRLPQCGDVIAGERMCFHLRAGGHFFSRTDWLHYLAFAKRFLGM